MTEAAIRKDIKKAFDQHVEIAVVIHQEAFTNSETDKLIALIYRGNNFYFAFGKMENGVPVCPLSGKNWMAVNDITIYNVVDKLMDIIKSTMNDMRLYNPDNKASLFYGQVEIVPIV